MSKRRAPSPNDFLPGVLLLAGIAALAVLACCLILGATLVTGLFGSHWRIPQLGSWASSAVHLITSPGRPATAFGWPWSSALSGHASRYWIATALVICSISWALVTASVVAWQRWGPIPGGHATREDVRRELSLSAARATAEWTRPSLSPAERRRAPLAEVAVPMHRNPYDGTPLCTPLENPTGTLAPTQSGKSRRDLAHKALCAPGALLCSTTKPDLLEFTALARARSRHAPVLVYDATSTVAWPAKLRWSPLSGCTDPATAYRRAHTMVEAASTELADVTGNDKVFRSRATTVMQAYFLAAAYAGYGVRDLVRWATSKPLDQEPIRILHTAGYPNHARNLRVEIGMVAETSDAVWLSVRRVIEPWMDTRLANLCTPGTGEDFDARAFIKAGGSLYLVAGQTAAAQAAPILTALVEHWLTTAQDMALGYPTRRVDPVVTTVLDELTTATPVSQLPAILADSAGRGVLVHWGDQSLASLEMTYTPAGARRLLDNTTTLSVWGGLKDQRTLEWISLLTGHHERRRHQVHSDNMFGPSRTSVGIETVPTFRPGEIRTIARNRVLVIHRHLDPILARTNDIRNRPDWPAIRADVAAVRAGIAPIGPGGYLDNQPNRPARGGARQ